MFRTQPIAKGDVRTNQNPQLTVTTIVWMREHNRIANELLKLNPTWDDERIFQTARAINIAQWQHITYYELLPLYAGYEALVENGVIYKAYYNAYIDDYDENVKPSIYNEAAHGALRQFHSLIAGKMGLFNENGCRYDDLVLRDHLHRPVALEKSNVFDGLVRGLFLQPSMPSDIYYDSDFTRHMFMRYLIFGQDTKSIDIQRSRDHGLPTYNDMRVLCGLKRATTFEDFLDVMTKERLQELQLFYKNVDDVEYIVGLAAETNVKGTLAGPTALCVIYRQFKAIRQADRFWYENKSAGFTPAQLRQIRKANVARILCDNTKDILRIQPKAFVEPSIGSIDGVCNNLDHPNWGTQYSVYDRLIPARYGNNNSIAHCGNGDPLPNARCVSTVIFSDETYPDPELTAYAAQYGQIIAHDMGQNFLTGDPLSCCNTWLGHWDEPPDDCISITVPDDDYHYTDLNASCMSVLRTVTNRQLECSLYLPDTAQLSAVTAYLDLSLIYGNTEDICMKLRTLEGGLLKLETRNQREWFPESTERDMFCPLLNENELCYHTGRLIQNYKEISDPRVDQNPPLCITHLLWAREHNRVARRLGHLNPHWSDEEIFKIARTIVIAEYQHIAYYELLPYYMGEYNLLESRILYYTDDFINDYNASMRPHVFNEHSQAAFRHFHSLVPGLLSLVDASGCPYRSIVMRDYINRPGVLEKGDYLDSIIRGMVTQPALTPDAYCDPEDVEKLISLYDHPDDIDLIVGVLWSEGFMELWQVPHIYASCLNNFTELG
ncbi:unnamed protein product [Diabrotica balteata]|uniref:Peroxidase n=1 Tax=Diabrotica balteata TaxID=107213 RepID=A0A9N9SP42_DIABA|nr:unnamed protein product [Diabrotica balteata]